MEFLRANIGTIVVGAVVFAGLAAVLIRLIRGRKSGCGCAGCPGCGKTA